LLRDVTGTPTARDVLALYAFRDKTKNGRRPDCS
jgi:hypothetical protein